MSRYTGPTWKKSRRYGFSLTETGKELQKRDYAPGQHGKNQARKKITEYGTQLREKQRMRFMYGINEKQFRKIFDIASKKEGIHGDNFMFALESRLDNLVYRGGFAQTRAAARQLVNHGHFLVNGKKMNIPSYTCKPGDVISVREKSKGLVTIKNSLEAQHGTLPFVVTDKTKLEMKFERMPERSELNQELNAQLIVEFYSR